MQASQRSDGAIRLTSFLFAASLAFCWTAQWALLKDFNLASWLGSDSYLVVERMRLAQGGIGSLHPLTTSYFGQFGLQGMILGALVAESVLSIPEWAVLASFVLMLASASTYALLVPVILPQVGQIGIAIFWVSLAASPWLIGFSSSLYWILPTLIAPMVIMARLGSRLSKGGRSTLYPLTALFLAFLVKCLCGYEYITTVTLLACAGYALSGAEWPTTFSRYVLVVTTCVSAFAVGVILQILQLQSFLGEGSSAEIIRRVLLHTGTDGGAYAMFLDPLISHLIGNPANAVLIENIQNRNDSWLIFSTSFFLYFGFAGFNIFFLTIEIWVFCLIAAMAAAGLLVSSASSRSIATLFRPHYAVQLATALALAGAVSWQILAWRHMVVHFHLNGIVFAIGLIPLAALWTSQLFVSCCSVIQISARNVLELPALQRAVVYLSVGSSIMLGGHAILEAVRASPLSFASGETDGSLNGRIDNVTFETSPPHDELARGMGEAYDWVTVEGWGVGARGPTVLEIVREGTVRATVRPNFPHPTFAQTDAADQLTGFRARIPLGPSTPMADLTFYLRYERGARFRVEVPFVSTATTPAVDTN